MAYLAQLPGQLLRVQARRAVVAPHARLVTASRSFSTARWSSARSKLVANKSIVASKRQIRLLSSTPRVYNATQEAPNAQAYLNSGAITGARDLVDVKKVLVIGAGGLSIGQAGEFDYSGMPVSISIFFNSLGVFGCEVLAV
jgi:carbamoyl-phosphate synthase large subunit